MLDEPTSALDLPNQKMVIDLLQKVANKGKTIIISTHNPNHASYLHSNVVLMKNGKIINEGSYKKLITLESLKPVYGDKISYASDAEYKTIV